MSELAEYVREELDGYYRSRLTNRLARKSGIDKKTLHCLRTGKHQPSLNTLETLLDAMDIDIILKKRRLMPWDE